MTGLSVIDVVPLFLRLGFVVSPEFHLLYTLVLGGIHEGVQTLFV